MTPASSEELVAILGEVDELTIKRLLEIRASIDEVGEALDELEDERFGEERRIPSTTRVAEVRSVLDELFADEDEAEETSIVGAPI